MISKKYIMIVRPIRSRLQQSSPKDELIRTVERLEKVLKCRGFWFFIGSIYELDTVRSLDGPYYSAETESIRCVTLLASLASAFFGV